MLHRRDLGAVVLSRGESGVHRLVMSDENFRADPSAWSSTV
jgi:hypothetical protein